MGGRGNHKIKTLPYNILRGNHYIVEGEALYGMTGVPRPGKVGKITFLPFLQPKALRGLLEFKACKV